MAEERPTKWVRFEEPVRDLPDAKHITEYSPKTNLPNGGLSHLAIPNVNKGSSSSISPSAQDIYKWTNSHKAIAPVLHQRRSRDEGKQLSKDPISSFIGWDISLVEWCSSLALWLGSRTVRTGGYTQVGRAVDDSTAVIDCMLCHPNPYAHLDSRSRSEAIRLSKLGNALHPPPPIPITAIGYPIQVIGKVSQFHSEQQIKAESIKPCESTNDQWIHVQAVVELHKLKYSVPKPFEIPVETHAEKLIRLASFKQLLHAHEPSSPLTHGTSSVPASLLIPRTMHYMQHGLGDARRWDLDEDPLSTPTKLRNIQTDGTGTLHDQAPTSAVFTLSHLRRVPELAFLACRVVNAETRRHAGPDVDAKKAGQTQTSSVKTVKTHSRWSSLVRVRMKHLFMWALVKLYQEGSIVLYDRLLPPPSATVLVSNLMFSSPSLSSAKCVVPEEDGYLSDPLMYEEDEAYVPVTLALLAAPVREIMRAMGIMGKSPEVRAQDIMRHLNDRWVHINLQTVEEAIQLIVID
ncbi:hypothetical protein EDB19DRAFT_1822957 [Suillus lakei]|nr:hypothetical protein EDB19DRAFT_1822957 [Suillus lakei]